MNSTEQVTGWAARNLEPLTEEEARVLEFEGTWAQRGLRKNAGIAALGMSVSHYYLVLNHAIAKPIAELENPELIRRLKRMREVRETERHGRR
ncbi:MAG: DUF3263 domain-containing protein [Ancrocorticia sp.]|uniref:DUF3263 domain-containing protein n=1 Tax=Ancrocorticia sp. TaxID=2593684 RepID=UPI003F91FF91